MAQILQSKFSNTHMLQSFKSCWSKNWNGVMTADMHDVCRRWASLLSSHRSNQNGQKSVIDIYFAVTALPGGSLM